MLVLWSINNAIPEIEGNGWGQLTSFSAKHYVNTKI